MKKYVGTFDRHRYISIAQMKMSILKPLINNTAASHTLLYMSRMSISLRDPKDHVIFSNVTLRPHDASQITEIHSREIYLYVMSPAENPSSSCRELLLLWYLLGESNVIFDDVDDDQMMDHHQHSPSSLSSASNHHHHWHPHHLYHAK